MGKYGIDIAAWNFCGGEVLKITHIINRKMKVIGLKLGVQLQLQF